MRGSAGTSKACVAQSGSSSSLVQPGASSALQGCGEVVQTTHVLAAFRDAKQAQDAQQANTAKAGGSSEEMGGKGGQLANALKTQSGRPGSSSSCAPPTDLERETSGISFSAPGMREESDFGLDRGASGMKFGDRMRFGPGCMRLVRDAISPGSLRRQM